MSEEKKEQCFCKSYYNDDHVLKDCTCGKCNNVKIYNSTEYIEKPCVGDLKLEVNSMWNFKSRSVCFQTIDSAFGGGKTTISYDLKECTEVNDSFVIGSNPPKPCKNTKWKQAEITKEIVNKLSEKGYTLAKEYD